MRKKNNNNSKSNVNDALNFHRCDSCFMWLRCFLKYRTIINMKIDLKRELKMLLNRCCCIPAIPKREIRFRKFIQPNKKKTITECLLQFIDFEFLLHFRHSSRETVIFPLIPQHSIQQYK